MHLPLMTQQLIASRKPVAAIARTPERPAVVASGVGLVHVGVAGEVGDAGEGAVAGGADGAVGGGCWGDCGGGVGDGKDGDGSGRGGEDGEGGDRGGSDLGGGGRNGGDGVGGGIGSRIASVVVDEVCLHMQVEGFFG